MNLLLDSHTLLWLMEGGSNLSGTATALLADGSNQLHLSIASCWGIAVKVGLKKMVLCPLLILPDHGGERVRGDRVADHAR